MGKRRHVALFALSVVLLAGFFLVVPERHPLEASGNWVARTQAGVRNWRPLAVSANGTKLAAAEYGGYIYISSDSGATWSARTAVGTHNWTSIAMSQDGSNLVAAAYGDYLFTSTDGGATWKQRNSSGVNNWIAVACDSACQELVAAVFDGGIYTSPDYGSAWKVRASAGVAHWYGLTMSADGNKVAAVEASPGYVHTSTDGGSSWITRSSAGTHAWRAIAGSADGTKLVAAEYDGYIYTSQDSGASWVARPGAGADYWDAVDCSQDCSVIIAGELFGSTLLVSPNGGASWAAQTSAGAHSWEGVGVSQSGATLVAAAYGNYIYTNQSTVSTPTLTITGDGTNPASSYTGQPITIAATFAAGQDDSLAATAINDYQSNLWCGSGITCDQSMWTAAPMGQKSYTFTPTAAGTYVFYPAAQTVQYPSWSNYGQSLTVTVADPCPNGTGAAGSCTSCSGGYVLVGAAPSNSCQLACPHGTGAAGQCTACDSGYTLQGGTCIIPTAAISEPLRASPARVRAGGQTSLSWTTSGMSSCRVTDNTNTVLSTALSSAGLPIAGITNVTSFLLTCSDGATQYVSGPVTVSLLPAFQEI